MRINSPLACPNVIFASPNAIFALWSTDDGFTQTMASLRWWLRSDEDRGTKHSVLESQEHIAMGARDGPAELG